MRTASLQRNDPLHYLARGWSLLKLSVDTPERVQGWDAVVLTAASRHQADIYEAQVEAARRRGMIGERTRAFVIADPHGQRIGSGGATLNALRRLAETKGARETADMRVLLIHAGGDSRRSPWANILGKCFIPFPLLADPDRAVPALFDHQLAMAAPLAAGLEQGGLVSFSGDVIPLFDSFRVRVPRDDALVVTVPVSLDVAERHGVIVADEAQQVTDLLQKAPASELVARGALVGRGAALLDTGIYAFSGQSFKSLIELACATPDPVQALIDEGAQISLYEELAAPLVARCRGNLSRRPLGERLLAALDGPRLWSHQTDMQFVHFGRTAEVLEHVVGLWGGRLARRVMAESGPGVSASAVLCDTVAHPDACIGDGSLVCASRLGPGARIGNRCIVLGVETYGRECRLANDVCLWQVPIERSVVTACCGVDDDPKLPMEQGTFCNRSFGEWMRRHGVEAAELWPQGGEQTLWNAALFPAGNSLDGFDAVFWMLAREQADPAAAAAWRRASRLSLGELHARVDVAAFMQRREQIVSELVLRTLCRTVSGSLDRNIASLAAQLPDGERSAEVIGLSDSAPGAGPAGGACPQSRLVQMRADLLEAAGAAVAAAELRGEAFEAVHAEVAASVRRRECETVAGLPRGARERVMLPVRFDIAGGWSDTPPYCLERPARVLNLAMMLDGELPVGAEVEALPGPVWELVLEDSGQSTRVESGSALEGELGLKDAFTLLRKALVLLGYGSASTISQGVRVRTWARVPRGSGLGTSSILGAALVQALQRLAGRPADVDTVSDLVLELEQRMTTGGGWQDQVGGLVPGVKCTSSAPVLPLSLKIEPIPLMPDVVRELHERLVIAFTGRERLAKNVLQIVVGRYLQRDRRALDAVAQLVALAAAGREALALGSVDDLGRVMKEAWHVHQELDPHCSTPEVDAIFHSVGDYAVGWKLAGAGGGGFLGALAKDADAARRMRDTLAGYGRGVRVYGWRLWERPEEP